MKEGDMTSFTIIRAAPTSIAASRPPSSAAVRMQRMRARRRRNAVLVSIELEPADLAALHVTPNAPSAEIADAIRQAIRARSGPQRGDCGSAVRLRQACGVVAVETERFRDRLCGNPPSGSPPTTNETGASMIPKRCESDTARTPDRALDRSCPFGIIRGADGLRGYEQDGWRFDVAGRFIGPA
jgi:hypothetical protein